MLAVDDIAGVIGFATAGPARRDEYSGMHELMALYVHPAWHGSGVAQALTRQVLPADVLATTGMMLWVLDGNERAMRFYVKLGFEPQDVWARHEPTGVREQLMVRPPDVR